MDNRLMLKSVYSSYGFAGRQTRSFRLLWQGQPPLKHRKTLQIFFHLDDYLIFPLLLQHPRTIDGQNLSKIMGNNG